MNRTKKNLIIVGILLIILFLFRGFLYRFSVNYTKIGVRNEYSITNKKLISEIQNEINNKDLALVEIIKISKKITNKLTFTSNKTSNNPNEIYETGKANCIGYSAMFSSIGNYIIKEQEKSDKYKFEHIIGKLDFFGLDIHKLFRSPFFKDHDYNEVIDIESGEKLYIDPSLNDYLKINRIAVKE